MGGDLESGFSALKTCEELILVLFPYSSTLLFYFQIYMAGFLFLYRTLFIYPLGYIHTQDICSLITE